MFIFPSTGSSIGNPESTIQPYKITLDGISFVQDALDALRNPNSENLLELFSSTSDFADSLEAWFNLPTAVQLGMWNSFALTGLAPGSVYVTVYPDGFREFNQELNQNFGSAAYQISWHQAKDPDDWSGPIVDFF